MLYLGVYYVPVEEGTHEFKWMDCTEFLKTTYFEV